MVDHVWSISEDIYLLIENDVVHILESYIQNSTQPEAGGCLFGFYRDRHIHITNCSYPKNGDSRQLRRFDRKDKGHVSYGKELYRKSNQLCTYLGEWHTHPQDIPTPSHIDFVEWDKITKNKKKWKTVAIIVGRSKLWVGVGDITSPIRQPLNRRFY